MDFVVNPRVLYPESLCLISLTSRNERSSNNACFQACFMISFNTPVKYMDTTPDLHKIYTYQKCVPILINKQLLTQRLFFGTISLYAHLKDLNTFNLLKHLKLYLLSEQYSEISNISTCSIFSNFMYISHSLAKSFLFS